MDKFHLCVTVLSPPRLNKKWKIWTKGFVECPRCALVSIFSKILPLVPSLHHMYIYDADISNSGSHWVTADKRFIEVNGNGESLPFEKLLRNLKNNVNWFIMVMVMVMMKEKGVHAVWSWWLIDGHRNLSCLEDIQTWDQSWFLSRPLRNSFFLTGVVFFQKKSQNFM